MHYAAINVKKLIWILLF